MTTVDAHLDLDLDVVYHAVFTDQVHSSHIIAALLVMFFLAFLFSVWEPIWKRVNPKERAARRAMQQYYACRMDDIQNGE